MSFLEKLRSYFYGEADDEPEIEPLQSTDAPAAVQKTGTSVGELEVDGEENDEIVAVILAAVSNYTDIPMNELKITSIKAVE